MAKNKKHIPQKPDDQYPKPDISADDAWKDMLGLLETELPKSPEGQNLLKKTANAHNYLMVKAIVATVIIVGITFLVFDQNKSEHTNPVDQVTQTTIPATDSALHISHEKNATKKTAETRLITANSVNGTEKTPESISYIDSADFPPGITTPLEEREKTIKESTKSDNFKDTEHANKAAIGNSRAIDLKKPNPENVIITKNNLSSNSSQAIKRPPITSEQDIKLIRTEESDQLISNGSSSKSPELDESKRPIYCMSLIKNHKINTTNRLAGYDQKPRRPSAIPLTIKDSTAAKRNRAFWNSLHAGLLWNVGIPFQSGTSILTQANGKKQIWPILIPGIWISKEFDAKNAMLLWAKLANQHFGNKLIQSTNFKTSDSTGRYYEKFLLVNQAFQLGLQYNRTFSDRFQLGVGVAYNHTYKALLHGKETVYPVIRTQSDTTYTIKKSNLDWPLIRPAYVSGRVEAVYSFGKIKTGVALTIPITSPTDSVKTRPVNGQIFLRWQIR